MTTFQYRGLSPDGEKVSGVIQAYNEYEAAAQLRERCLVITGIRKVKRKPLLSREIGSTGAKPGQLSVLCAQLSMLLSSGLPLVQCIELVAEQSSRGQREILRGVAEDVAGGYSLTQCFAKNYPHLPQTFLQTLRAGEAAGALEHTFRQLHLYYDKTSKTREKIVDTLTYPVIVVCVAVVVFFVIMGKAVPVFVSAYQELGSQLPAITRWMIGLSDFLRRSFPEGCCLLLALGFLAALSGRVSAVRGFWDRLCLTGLPLKRIHMYSEMSRVAATMTTMLGAGMPALQALEVTAQAMQNLWVSAGLFRVCRSVEQGKTLSAAMGAEPCFPQLLVEMVHVAEQADTLEQTFRDMSDYYENSWNLATQRLLSLMEPVITLVLAVATVLLLLGVYLPMFQMYGAVG